MTKEGDIAKLTRQSPQNVLQRKHLFATLNQAIKKPLTWVCAPPGAGKTVLVSSFIESLKLKSLWYQVDEGDDDPATFFYYMGHAVRKTAPAKKEPLPLLTPEYLPGVTVFTRRYFENLYNRFKPPFIIVFDNYHELPVNSKLHELLIEGIILAPQGISIVIISRANPPAEYSKLRAKDMISFIEWKDIQFTFEESKALVCSRGFNEMSEETIRQLYTKTDGWVAGLILMLERARTENFEEQYVVNHSHQDIFDYFASEIFKKLDIGTQEFLMKTAFLPRMTVEMACSLSEQQSAGRILEDLTNKNYFTNKHHGSDALYQYHDLFREFLLTRAQSYFRDKELQIIYEKAASVLEMNNKLEEAVELFQKSGKWDSIRRIIKNHAQDLIYQGRNNVLVTWLKMLPDKDLNQDPWLLYWFGEAIAIFNPAQGRKYFEKAFTGFEQQRKNITGLYMAWCGIIETFIYEYGNFAPIGKWVHMMEELMSKHKRFPSKEIEVRVLSFMVYALIHYAPYHPKLETWVNRTIILLKYIKDTGKRLDYLFPVVHYYSWTGNISKVALLKDLITTPSGLLPIRMQLMQKMYGASHARHLGLKDECLRTVKEGLEIANKYGVHFLDHMIIVQAVYLHLGRSDLKSLKEYLQKMEPTVNRSNALHTIQYDTLLGWFEHLQGNNSIAIEKIKGSLELSIKSRIPFAQGLCHLALAHLLHENNAYKESQQHFRSGLLISKRMKSKSLEFIAYNLKAYWLLGNELNTFGILSQKTIKVLSKCMKFGKTYGFVNAYFLSGDILTKLFIAALENNIEIGYVKDVIRRLELFPDPHQITCESWPWKFKIYTLGHFKIFREDKPIILPKKPSFKPLELLQILIVHREGVTSEQAGAALWPEAAGDYAHQALDTNIYRLRKFLGFQDALLIQGGMISLNPRYCWTDVMAFEQYLVQLDELLHEPDTGKDALKRKKIATIINAVMGLYKGHFMFEDRALPWAIHFRNTLKQKFVNFIEQAGMYYERMKDTKNALRIYQRGIEIDREVELFYLRLMMIYKALGQHTDAMLTYKSCATALFNSLGVEPSEQLKTLYHSIKP